jgi:hypothetical protein
MIFLLTSCLRTIARTESFLLSTVDTVNDIRFDLNIFLIFLSEEDFNTEVKQLDNDEDEKKKCFKFNFMFCSEK